MRERNRRVEAEGNVPRHHELRRHAPARRRRAAADGRRLRLPPSAERVSPDAAAKRALERQGLAGRTSAPVASRRGE